MAGLRRNLELLVNAINAYREFKNNPNSIRTELVEIFEPLMTIMHDSLIHLQRNFSGESHARSS